MDMEGPLEAIMEGEKQSASQRHGMLAFKTIVIKKKGRVKSKRMYL